MKVEFDDPDVASLFEGSDSGLVELSIPDEDVAKFLAKYTVGTSTGRDEIVRDIESSLIIGDASVRKTYRIAKGIRLDVKISDEVRMTAFVKGKPVRIYSSPKNSVDIDEIEMVVFELRKDPKLFVLKKLVCEDYEVNRTMMIPSSIAEVFLPYVYRFNSHYSVIKPEILEIISDNYQRDIVKIQENAHLLVGVYRDEMPDVPSGVFGSLVRKGALITIKALKVYYPSDANANLNGREKKVFRKVLNVFNERLKVLKEMYSINITPEEVIEKVRRLGEI